MSFSNSLTLLNGLFSSLASYLLNLVMYRSQPTKQLPKPQGPYAVGIQDLMWDYSAKGVFLRVFYPTTEKASTLNVTWLPEPKYRQGLARFTRIWPLFFNTLFRLVVGDVYVPAIWKAQVLKKQNGWPLVIFSHGLGGCRSTYSTLCVEIASHGFVVAATEHRDATACLSYYFMDEIVHKKQWIEYRRILKGEEEYPIRNAQVHQRADECRRAVDVLLRLNRGDSWQNAMDNEYVSDEFQGLFDESRIGIAGHSFGGATSVSVLDQDPRFKVGVALDAWMYPVRLDRLDNIQRPLLFVNMEKFQTDVNVSTMKKVGAGGVPVPVIVTLKGGVHQNVSDVPFLSDNSSLQAQFNTKTSVTPLLAMNIISALTLDYLWTHLSVEKGTWVENYLKKLKDHQYLLITEPSASLTSKY